MYYLSSIYSVTIPLHVSGLLVVHHQEVTMYICNKCYVLQVSVDCQLASWHSQKPLPDNTKHLQQTNAHASGGIRTHNLSRRAAAHLRLSPRGHWDLNLQG
jgi:hypothetical protein